MTVSNTEPPNPNDNDPITKTPGQTFDASDQKLETGGQTFSPDGAAALALGSEILSLYPGEKADVTLPYDVPVGIAPGVLEVHDSAWSTAQKSACSSSAARTILICLETDEI